MIRCVLIAAALAAMPLAGCATTTATSTSTPVANLQTFTVADLQAALADAKAHNDTVAATCYTALIPAVQQVGTSTLTLPVGAVSAFQKARDLANGVVGTSSVIQNLNVPCAPLVLDSQATIAKLVAMVGGTAALAATVAPVVAPAVP